MRISPRSLRCVPLSLILALLACGGASADTMTWKFRNQSEETLFTQLYSRERGQVWPSQSEAWHVDPTGIFYEQPISCVAGEYVCYGAWNRDKRLSWGLGPEGKGGCSDCCYHCGEGALAWVTLFIHGESRLVGAELATDTNGAVSGVAVYVLSWQKSGDDATVSGKLRLVDIVADRRTPAGLFAFNAVCSGNNPTGVEIPGQKPFTAVNPDTSPPEGEKLDYDLWWAACRGQFAKF